MVTTEPRPLNFYLRPLRFTRVFLFLLDFFKI